MSKYLALGIFVVFLGCALAVAQNVEVATTIAFTEGPTVDADGNVFFTDQTNDRIMKRGVPLWATKTIRRLRRLHRKH